MYAFNVVLNGLKTPWTSRQMDTRPHIQSYKGWVILDLSVWSSETAFTLSFQRR